MLAGLGSRVTGQDIQKRYSINRDRGSVPAAKTGPARPGDTSLSLWLACMLCGQCFPQSVARPLASRGAIRRCTAPVNLAAPTAASSTKAKGQRRLNRVHATRALRNGAAAPRASMAAIGMTYFGWQRTRTEKIKEAALPGRSPALPNRNQAESSESRAYTVLARRPWDWPSSQARVESATPPESFHAQAHACGCRQKAPHGAK